MSVTNRNVYSYLDWIGDVGGLVDGLNLILAGIVGLLNFNSYNAYMVSHLFRIDEKSELDIVKRSLTERMKSTVKSRLDQKANNNIDYKKVTSIKMLFFYLIPSRFRDRFNKTKLKCCRRTLKYRLLENG